MCGKGTALAPNVSFLTGDETGNTAFAYGVSYERLVALRTRLIWL